MQKWSNPETPAEEFAVTLSARLRVGDDDAFEVDPYRLSLSGARWLG